MVDASPMLKNAARHTPLAGSLQTSRNYFAGLDPDSGKGSPIVATCQRNYVVLATDGNPTAKKDGSVYPMAQTVNARDPVTGLYTFGAAAQDVFTEVQALRSTNYSGRSYDVQTFVVGLGDSVANPSSIAALDEIAKQGGTGNAYLASSGSALTAAFQSIVGKIESENNASSSVALNTNSYNTGATVYQAKFNWSTRSGDLLALPIGDGRLSGYRCPLESVGDRERPELGHRPPDPHLQAEHRQRHPVPFGGGAGHARPAGTRHVAKRPAERHARKRSRRQRRASAGLSARRHRAMRSASVPADRSSATAC